MRRNILYFFCVFFLSGSLFARSAELLFSFPVDFKKPSAGFVQTTDALRSVSWIKANYKEERRLPFLKEPIRSEGVIFYAPQIGLCREMVQPMAQKWVVTLEGMSVTSQEENSSFKSDNHGQEFQSGIRSFLTIFSGNLAEWEKQFDLFYKDQEDGWQLGFRPKRKNFLSQFARVIVLSGTGARVQTMRWEGKDGDVTQTWFGPVEIRTDLSKIEIQSLFEAAANGAKVLEKKPVQQ